MQKGSKNTKQTQKILLNFRKVYTVITVVNLLLLLERSIFDLMGYMFGMIVVDLVYTVFLIVGLFGSYQYRVNYVAASTIVTLIWIGWNIFVICVYLNIGFLDRYDPVVLNFNTDRKSWWFANSVGCRDPVANKLEQHLYEQQLNEIKMLIDMPSSSSVTDVSTTTTTTTTTTAAATTTMRMLMTKSRALILATTFLQANNSSTAMSSMITANSTHVTPLALLAANATSIISNRSSSALQQWHDTTARIFSTYTMATKVPTTTTQSSFLNDLLLNPGVFEIRHYKNYTYLDNFVRANCALPFYVIEIMHSAVLICFSVFTIIFGLLLANAFNDDDDTFDYIGGFDTMHPHVIGGGGVVGGIGISGLGAMGTLGGISLSAVNGLMVGDQQLIAHQVADPLTGQIRLEPLYAP